MSNTPRRTLIQIIASAVLTGAVFSAAAPAQAADLVPGFYKPGYTDVITTVQGAGADATTHETSFSEWGAAGYPSPLPSPTEYVRYPWAATVYAVTYWPDGWQWDQLSFPQWQRAGTPAPRAAGWVDGSVIFENAGSEELFFSAPDDTIHKLTPEEWRATGFEPVEIFYENGFAKRSWSPAIMDCSGDFGGTSLACGPAISGEDWEHQGRPTPALVQRIAGDTFTRARGSADIYAEGIGLPRTKLTPEQWVAAGRPTPVVR